MNSRLLQNSFFVLALGAAFLIGRGVQPALAGSDASALRAGEAPAADSALRLPRTGPQDPGGQDPGAGGSVPGGTTASNDMLVYGEAVGAPMGSNGIIAVTGSYGVGTSVLYVVDTNTKQLAVYEARGGSNSMRRLVLVGARRIDLDLSLEGYNDESEYDYRALQRRFEKGAEQGEERPRVGLPGRDR